jgi:hypothetical protein
VKFTSLVAPALLALLATSARADSLNVYDWDTRGGGSYAPVANSADGNGSLQLATTNAPPIAGVNQDKVAVLFATGTGPLGTLGQLTDLSLDAFKSSSPATGAVNDFAYRLQFASGDSLVYENAYNGSATVPTGVWRDLDLTGGKFWLYDKATNTNFNGGSDAHPLSFYSSLATSQIVGLQVAYGSGLGAFSGNVDNVHLQFGDRSFDGAVVTPLPAAVWGGVVLFGMVGGKRLLRRRESFRAVAD